MKFITLLIASMVFLSSCTDNSRAKSWGGTSRIDLPKGEKLLMATWKEQQLWYLTRPMKENDIPEFLTFQENSSFGLIEGKVIFHESK